MPTISDIKDYIAEEDTLNQKRNMLDKLNPNPYYYSRHASVSLDEIIIKNYSGTIYTNFKKKKSSNKVKKPFEVRDDNHNEGDNGNSTNTDTTNNDEDSEKTITINDNDKTIRDIARSNHRRYKKISRLIQNNKDVLNTFITLTMGNIDYAESLKNSIEKNPGLEIKYFDNFNSNKDEIYKKLTGIKKIYKNKTKLNDEDLRVRVYSYFADKTNKKEIVKEKLNKEFKNILDTGPLNQKIKRKTANQLDNLICDKNPYEFDDAKILFGNFKKRIKRKVINKSEDIDKFNYVKVYGMNDDGRLHIHMLCNLPYVDQWELQKIWGNGIVDVSSVKNLNLDDEGTRIYRNDSTEKKFKKLVRYFFDNNEKISATKLDENEKEKSEYNGSRQLYSASNDMYQPIETTSHFFIEEIIKKILDKNNYKPKITKPIKSTSEYGKDFELVVYKEDTKEIRKEMIRMENQILQEIVDIAEERNQEDNLDEIFNEVMIKYGLAKDFGVKY